MTIMIINKGDLVQIAIRIIFRIIKFPNTRISITMSITITRINNRIIKEGSQIFLIQDMESIDINQILIIANIMNLRRKKTNG